MVNSVFLRTCPQKTSPQILGWLRRRRRHETFTVLVPPVAEGKEVEVDLGATRKTAGTTHDVMKGAPATEDVDRDPGVVITRSVEGVVDNFVLLFCIFV